MKQYCLIGVLITIVSCSNSSLNSAENKTSHWGTIALTDNQRAINNSLFEFSSDVISTYAKGESDMGKNILISPISLAYNMALLINGTTGETRSEIINALGLNNESVEELNKYIEMMLGVFGDEGSLSVFNPSSSIWARTGICIKRDFSDIVNKYFETSLYPDEPFDDTTLKKINKWIELSTRGLSKSYYSQSDLFSVQIAILNSIFFKGDWKSPFDAKNTKNGKYVLSNGIEISVPVMHQEYKEPIRCCCYDSLKAVRLPYNGCYSFMIVMPEGNIDDYFYNFSKSRFRELTQSFLPYYLTLSIPRFRIEYKNDHFVDLMQKFGIKRLFSPLAELSPLSDNPGLAVTKISQNNIIDFNEKGTVVASVTTSEIGYSTNSPIAPEYSKISININKPFLFYIIENQTNSILLAGKICNPIQG